MKGLRNFEDYEDFDVVSWQIAVDLGIIDPEQYNLAVDCKHVFWSNHPVGGAIYQFIENLVQQGLLEENPEEPSQFRWNRNYRGSWEKLVREGG